MNLIFFVFFKYFDWVIYFINRYMKLSGETDSRWVHVDPCEGIYNAPLTYQVGWNKKIDYVMGVTLITGDIQDITWRYTNDFRTVIFLKKTIPFHISSSYKLNYKFEINFTRSILMKK